MGKPTICIGENKDADQLRGNREADQRLCFRYTDSTIPLLPTYEISCFQLSSVTVKPDLCRTCSEATLLVFPRGGSFNIFSGFTEYRFNLMVIKADHSHINLEKPQSFFSLSFLINFNTSKQIK